MKARNPSTGNLETVYVKALDSMPVGSVVDFTGSSADVPAGWEEVNDYSTTEIDTGKKWVDGKKIYRKCIPITLNNQSGFQLFPHNISNLDTFTSLSGIIKNPSSPQTTRPLPLADTTTSNNIRIDTGLDNNVGVVSVKHDASWNGYNGYVILEYTKTS